MLLVAVIYEELVPRQKPVDQRIQPSILQHMLFCQEKPNVNNARWLKCICLLHTIEAGSIWSVVNKDFFNISSSFIKS
jgi:hypothetical protein